MEVGTFTGYSAMCIARGLAPGGALLCCDVSEEWTAIARRAWEPAGLDDRIELRIAPAVETLRRCRRPSTIDLAFIDADKPGYRHVLGRAGPPGPARRAAPGRQRAVVGRIADPDADDANGRALRASTTGGGGRPGRVVILPAFDGLTIARKPGKRSGAAG